MQPIVSGTTTERIVRTSLLTLMVCGFSALSFKDGYYSYPRENVESVIKSLGLDLPDPPPPINPELTDQSARALTIQRRQRVEQVISQVGGEPLTHGESVYFFGHGGFLRLEVDSGRVVKHEWIGGPKHDATSLLFQKIMGYALAPLGLLLLVQFVRVLTTKAALSSDGLKVRGRPLIPLDMIKGFQADRFRKKGFLDVEYAVDGKDGSIRLDEYVIKETRAIIEAICQETKLDNPLPPPKDAPEDTDTVDTDERES